MKRFSMKYFIAASILFTVLFVVTLEQIIVISPWYNLRASGTNAMRWATEGATMFGTRRNKTFTVSRVTRAQSRDELDGLIVRKRRRIDFFALTLNCSRMAGCTRELRYIMINYTNGTRLRDVFLL
ncbi:Hypothetical protein SRAE_X000225000 [Strongyloides ratti]|uniref:Uncharacterized protein n=1 Tax=Strongyloides ratti TaxID=34506 RepID=A0A090KXA7_STRRB|nr:Hypothetical protein SRAE_X000225000 [Strongyloides ratti]CEF60512.1 Hypothetical protein SRAE_X000225000 [Strongyloides ratti]